MERLFRHKWISIVAAAVSLSLIAAALAVALPGRAAALRGVGEELSRPFLSLLAGAGRQVDALRARFADGHALRAENDALRDQVAALAQADDRAALAEAENARLRALLDLAPGGQELDLLPAWPLVRAPELWRAQVTLDRGTDSGAAVGQLVLDARGAVVGRIAAAGARWSTLALLTDPDLVLGGQGAASGAIGAVTGGPCFTRLGGDGGERIVTYGPDGPRGLTIGTVTALEDDPGGLTRTASLRPAADLDRLGEVFLVTGWREGG